jgi:acetyl-CoA acyltransferase
MGRTIPLNVRELRECVIVDAVRSPIGRRGGSLAGVRPDDLLAETLTAVVDRTGVAPGAIEDVVCGCVTQMGEQGLNIGRIAALSAGLPVEVSGVSVNRMCGSSMQAAMQAATAIMAGVYDCAIACGVESMSRVAMGGDVLGSDGEPKPFSDRLLARHEIVWQGTSAELIAERWGIGRAEQDEYAARSHERAGRAAASGWFQHELVPIGGFAADETIRPQPDREKMAALQPAFRPDGTVTAGNASQIVDGAAAALLCTPERAAALGLEPRARFVAFAVAGVDPVVMLHGNPDAIGKALAKASLTLDDVAVVEINEAFAVVVLQAVNDLGLGDRMADVNPNGGGISLGHPLGATGARILATLLPELERRGERYGLASMCIGWGMAICGVVERL